ncbi:acyl-CoA dehydrogenase family protein [Rhodococcus wratislaviensis]|uniref:Acyl-CoA dehydrogenase n=1 Tax=Rhodococcus wratislaviensis NBRC 100605 TaxID=1219028 RepID=X0PWD0_RHOWR|nr:acyl-CoA dehydrogenase family protein [Rhodococcus wratislaviensis]GAF47588.1 acyl-CoA dehydrogenase [Rhodococcus wratislaviensis NBRC 100605]
MSLTSGVSSRDPAWNLLDDATVSILGRAREYLSGLGDVLEECERSRRFPAEIVRPLIDVGFVRGPIPVEDGGLGLTHLQSACLMEEAGRAWASVRTTANILTLVAELLSAAGTVEQKSRYLTPLLAGDRLGWFAITEREAGSDASALATRAERLPSGGYRLTGRKSYITNASHSDFGIVLATVDPTLGPRGITAFLVERSDGYRTVEHPHMPVRAVSSCDVEFDSVEVGPERVLGEVGRGLSLAMRGVNAGRLNVSAGCVGIAQACLDASREHVTTRQQFGKKLAEFQLVQKMVVDIATRTAAARELYRSSARLLDAGVDARAECSMAKYFCSESAVEVATQAVQVHGAIGLTEGHQVERLFRDAREATIPEGTSQMQILQIGKALLGVSAVR